MATLYLTTHNAVYLHVPYCAGTWVRNALQKIGVKTRVFGANKKFASANSRGTSSSKQGLVGSYPNLAKAYYFTFIRHPATWYLARWTIMMKNKKNIPKDEWPYDINDFAEYVRVNTAARYNQYTNIVAKYAGYTGTLCNYVGRTESITKDLQYVLNKQLGIPKPKLKKIERVPKLRRSGADLRKLTSAVLQMIYEAEQPVYTLYGYDITPATLLRENG